jgi:hypothetical protein
MEYLHLLPGVPSADIGVQHLVAWVRSDVVAAELLEVEPLAAVDDRGYTRRQSLSTGT